MVVVGKGLFEKKFGALKICSYFCNRFQEKKSLF